MGLKVYYKEDIRAAIRASCVGAKGALEAAFVAAIAAGADPVMFQRLIALYMQGLETALATVGETFRIEAPVELAPDVLTSEQRDLLARLAEALRLPPGE